MPAHQTPPRRSVRRGSSIVELLIAFTLIVIVAAVMFVNLRNRRSTVEVNLTTQRIAAMLREAQSRAMSQASSTSWGVHFDNVNSNQPFAALFVGTYSTSSRQDMYPLPVSLQFDGSFLAPGASSNVVFAQITGRPAASSTVTINLRISTSTSRSITIGDSGAIAW